MKLVPGHRTILSVLAIIGGFLGVGCMLWPASAYAQAAAVSPYTLKVFAQSANGYSAPDSITFNADNVFIGYGNHGNPDGTGGAQSTIVEYTMSGTVVQTFTVTGHNDGLRIDPADDKLWALQNEDASANLVIINPRNGRQDVFQIGTGAHGGGFDDIQFLGKSIYFSASNPTHSPNTFPAIVSVKFNGKKVNVTGVLNGDAQAIDVTSGAGTTLNLQDPDSMTSDPFGELVLDSQADGELVIVQHPGLSCQSTLVVPLSSAQGGTVAGATQADDTVFATSAQGQLMVADKGGEAVYSIAAPYFAPGAAYSAVDIFSNAGGPQIAAFVGQTNLTTGFVTPIVTGLSNPGGIAFIPAHSPNARRHRSQTAKQNSCP